MLPTDINAVVTRGVQLYKSREYEKAVEHLSSVIDQDKENWRARLYLGMSLFRLKQSFIAMGHFRAIISSCPDEQLKARAEAALGAMHSESKGMPKMTVECKVEEYPLLDKYGKKPE